MNIEPASPWGPAVRAIGGWSFRRGVPVWAVGGCVRDWILNRSTRDLDLVTEGDAGELLGFCRRRWGGFCSRFDRFHTACLRLKDGTRMDFARTRTERYARPAALPEVRFAPLKKDLNRRDFTVNAMAVRLGPSGWGELVDPCGGRADLDRGILRILHPLSFQEDPTRIWRAARFASRFGFRLDGFTLEKLKEAVEAGYPELLSRERVRAELLRLLGEKEPSGSLKKLKRWGVLSIFHPRFRWSPADFKAEGRWVRLGLLCVRMGRPGMDFLKSLHLERSVSQAILTAYTIACNRASPRSEITGLSQEILDRLFPKASPEAFSKAYLSGRDLAESRIPSGKEYAVILGQAARAQWKGQISNRPQALRWLRDFLKRRRG